MKTCSTSYDITGELFKTDDPEVTMFIGPSRTAEPLGVGVVTDEGGTAVMHAMNVRDKFLRVGGSNQQVDALGVSALSAMSMQTLNPLAPRQLMANLKWELLVLDWKKRQQTRVAVEVTINSELDAGLPDTYDRRIYSEKCARGFQHTFESYQGAAGRGPRAGWVENAV